MTLKSEIAFEREAQSFMERYGLLGISPDAAGEGSEKKQHA